MARHVYQIIKPVQLQYMYTWGCSK